MKPSRFTEGDIRAAFQLRAAGAPSPDLYHRITRATRQSRFEVRRGPARGRRATAHLAAIGAVAAALVLAPLSGAGSGSHRDPNVPGATESSDVRAPAVVATLVDDDDLDDVNDLEDDDGEDQGDDEDGFNADDALETASERYQD
jgi:hypothetical protein